MSQKRVQKRPEIKERYPTAKKISVQNIKGMQKEDWWRADVSRKSGEKGLGHGPTPQDATDKAYREAGGTVERKGRHTFKL